MTDLVSCGGVVFHRGKILLLYKNQNNRYTGWVMPKGTVEDGETYEETALREVKEEAGVNATIIEYIDKTSYRFKGYEGMIDKSVHWYLMTADTFDCKPQAEEFFADVGYYKRHEALHLLKFSDEKAILEKALKMMTKSKSLNKNPVYTYLDKPKKAVLKKNFKNNSKNNNKNR